MAETKKRFYIKKEVLIAMVERLQRGEEGAGTEIYNAFHDKVYGHIVKKAGSTEIADELVDIVLAEMIASVHKLRKPEAFVSWSNKITDHHIAAHFRKLRKDQLVDNELINMARDSHNTALEDAFAAAELLKLVNEKHARVLRMYFVEDLQIKEIAEIDGIPAGTVKSRLYYAKKALKTALGQRNTII